MTSNKNGLHVFRAASGIAILTLLLVYGANAATIIVNTSGGGSFTGIQDAINNASVEDTILVDSGIYFENVDVNKRLILKGNDTGGGKPLVDASGGDNAITLSAGNITIEGFAATNGSSNYSKAGFFINSSDNLIQNNDAFKNSQGIYLLGSNDDALKNNILIGNNASNNIYYGIYLDHSGAGNLTNNIMKGNGHNFRIFGNNQSHFNNQIDTSNLVNDKPIYYIKGAINSIYDSSINAGTFLCIDCVNVTIKDMSLNTNAYGLFFWNTTYSRIHNISASNNDDGISLWHSSINKLDHNEISNNYNGISLWNSSSNILYSNDPSNNYRGIYIIFSSINNTLHRNNVFNNEGDGIFLAGSNRNSLRDNNASNNNGNGIYLGGSNGNNLSNNDAWDNNIGIILDSSSSNTLHGNNASNNNQNGIYLGYSSSNMVNGNNATNNNENGIYLWYSTNNTLINNSMTENKYNFGLSGVDQSHYNNQIDISNMVDDKSIFYIKYAIDIVYDSSAIAGTFYCISCINITINNMTLNKNTNGILFWNTTRSRIQNVNASNNRNGISLWESTGNRLNNNSVLNNNNGVSLQSYSNNNLIYNNYFNNMNNAFEDGNNKWNVTKTSGENIIGGSNLGGNVWAMPGGTGFSQTCIESNNDGICDSPYAIDINNMDFLPLAYIPPYISFINPTPANGAILDQNYVYINTTASGSRTAFIDWNRSLMAWWRFNNESGETSTLFRDWSGWGNNGTCSGTTCPTFTPGKFGNALHFDGSNDYISAGHIASASSGTTLAWINPDGNYTGNQTVMTGTDNVGSDINVRYSIILISIDCPSGDWRTVIANGITFQSICSGQAYNSTNFPPGVWKQIAVTYNGSAVNFYLDDLLVKTVAQTASGAGDAQPYAIGRLGGYGKYYYNGKIDDARIYSRALSPEEIKASYDAGIYKLYGNFTDLPADSYDYKAYVQNLAGAVNQTETRTLILNASDPQI